MLHKRGGFSPSSSCTFLPSSLAPAVCLVSGAGVWGHTVVPCLRHTPREESPFVAWQPHWTADNLHAPHPNSLYAPTWQPGLASTKIWLPCPPGVDTAHSSPHTSKWLTCVPEGCFLLPGNCEQIWLGQLAGELQPHLPWWGLNPSFGEGSTF